MLSDFIRQRKSTPFLSSTFYCGIINVMDLCSLHRCGATQSGDLASNGEEALDGILGFGKSNSSVISQLASSGRVKKMFAHCLDGTNGGGIFAIGHVVQPKVNMTPLVPNQYVPFFFLVNWYHLSRLCFFVARAFLCEVIIFACPLSQNLTSFALLRQLRSLNFLDLILSYFLLLRVPKQYHEEVNQFSNMLHTLSRT